MTMGLVSWQLQQFSALSFFTGRGEASICDGPQWGGTHPRKARVGDPRAEKLKLYLYKFAEKWGLFYIFLARKWGLFYIVVTKGTKKSHSSYSRCNIIQCYTPAILAIMGYYGLLWPIMDIIIIAILTNRTENHRMMNG